MNISDAGLKFIASWEGLVNRLYDDAAGHCTIGVGHLVHLGNCDGRPEEQPFLNGLTDDECYALMRKDAQRFVDKVNREIAIPLTQNQFDALVDFAYNLGDLLTVAPVVNAHGDICGEIKKYTHAGGRVLQGLVRRRQAECDLWNREDDMTPEELARLEAVERNLRDLANGQEAVIKHNDVDDASPKLSLKGLWFVAGKAWPF